MKKNITKQILPLDEDEAFWMNTLETYDAKKPYATDKELEAYKKIFQTYMKKSKPMSLRLRQGTVMGLKKRSDETGIPYQVILQALAEQYVQGKIQVHL